ncbi:MAG: GAF domain-containing protein, partial [Spirochaetaceae bacterium]|nr:GAF domain-containing protein [Spirochaetaceae bacterium]
MSIERLRTLIEINSFINSSYADVNTLFVYILRSAMRLVACESGMLLLSRKEHSMLRFVVAMDPSGANMLDVPLPVNASIGGAVYSTQKSMIVNDVTHCSIYYKTIEEKTGFLPKKMIAVPMVVDSECVGVVELINKISGEDFDAEDLA